MAVGKVDAGPARSVASEWIVVVSALSLVLSSVAEARLQLGEAHVHPYLILLVPLGWGAVREAFEQRPVLVQRAGVFFLLFVVSMLPAGLNVAAVMKLGATLFTLLATAGMLKSRRGIGLGLIALAVSGALLSIKGIFFGSGQGYGINPFEEVGNKNNFSMYSIPAAYGAGIVLLDPRVGKWWRGVAIASFGMIVLATFQTANRSGWLGVVLCPAILAAVRLRRVKGTVLVCATLAALYGLFNLGLEADDAPTLFGQTTVFRERAEQTLQGYGSDDIRMEIFVACLELGLRNPLYGTSFNALTWELGRELSFPGGEVGPHNVLGLLIGGCGLLVTAAFLAFGRFLWNGTGTVKKAGVPTPESLQVLRGILLLWLLRGMFSDEVLYAPAFAIAIGILLAGVWLDESNERRGPLSSPPLTTGVRPELTGASRSRAANGVT